jgi:TPR repeat protein
MRYLALVAVLSTLYFCVHGDVETIATSEHPATTQGEVALPLPDKERFIRAPVYLQRAIMDADEDSNKDAAYLVGLACYYGDGVPLSYTEALRYFKKAAQNGHPQAAINVGYMYYNGIGASKDFNAAFGYYSIAANQDDPEGCYRAGSMLYAGEGHLSSQDRRAETAKAFQVRCTVWRVLVCNRRVTMSRLQLLSHAVAHNITGSRVLLGSLWEYGTFETGSNFTKARLLYEAGCTRVSGQQ